MIVKTLATHGLNLADSEPAMQVFAAQQKIAREEKLHGRDHGSVLAEIGEMVLMQVQCASHKFAKHWVEGIWLG